MAACMLALAPGCGETHSPLTDVSDVSELDATTADITEPVVPLLTFSEEAIPLNSTLLVQGDVSWVGVSQGIVIARLDGSLVRIHEDDIVPLTLPSLSTPNEDTAFEIQDLDALPNGDGLVLTNQGLFIVQGNEIQESPLNALFSGISIQRMEVISTEDTYTVYFATSEGLSRWSEGTVEDLALDGLATKNAQLAGHGSDLWVAAGDDIYRLEETSDGLQAWPESLKAEAQTFGVDARGRVWLQTKDSMHVKDTMGTWHAVETSDALTLVALNPESDGVWLWTADTLWQENEGIARPVDAFPEATTWIVNSDGMLWGASSEGLTGYSGGRSAFIEGWEESGYLFTATDFSVVLQHADVVDDISVRVDGESIALGENFTFTLDPELLGPGEHQLALSVSYTDTEMKSTSSVPFKIVVLSWETDIFPILDVHCGGCHGETGNVGLKLYTAGQWETAFDMILPSVESGFMPPPYTLDASDLQTIRHWGLTGFQP
jgi:hypothetical protein